MDPQYRLTTARREFGEFGGVNASVEKSTTFTVLRARTLPEIFSGQAKGCYVYGRSFAPNVIALSRSLAALEDTEAAYATASGMAAISSALLALCNAGDEIIASNSIYGGTYALLASFLPQKCNIKTTFVDIADLAAVQAAITSKTRVVYTEAVSNPTLVVADLPALSALAHGAGAQLMVDNTFTPMIITPTRWGADVVVHSMTKFMSGASDIIAGAICGTQAHINSLMDFHAGPVMLMGGTMDPQVASELALRLPHLGLRMTEHSRRALCYATRLEQLGAKVTYPGLMSHPGHLLMARLANPGYGFGGLLGLDMGTPELAEVFMERLQNKHSFGFLAVSLGYFDTLMSLSSHSTSSELSPEEKAASGISDGYIRMSVGITGTMEQRCTQLEEAYGFVARWVKEPRRYRATRTRREANGAISVVVSWPSLGPSEELVDDGEGSDKGELIAAGLEGVQEAEGGQEGASAVRGPDGQGVKRKAAAGAVKAPRRRAQVPGEEVTYRLVQDNEPASDVSIIGEEGLAL